MHLDWEIDSQRVEGGCPEKAQEVIEEGEYHCHQRGHHHISGPPHHSERAHKEDSVEWDFQAILVRDELALRPPARREPLHRPEYGLAKYLDERNQIELHSDYF